MNRDSLKLLLEQGLSLEEIGRRFKRHPSTVGYWVKKHGLAAVHKQRHAARGGIAREALASLIEEGATHGFMATALGVSVPTVRYWLKRYGLESARSERIRRARAERTAGRATIRLKCKHHGVTEFWLEGRGLYRCKKCRVEAVARRRALVRDTLIAEAGGCCVLCGYDRYAGALHFHHVDPSKKAFNLRGGVTPAIERLRAEARKCVLLCANCHAEVEGGVSGLPAKVLATHQDLLGSDEDSGVADLLDPG